MAERIACSALLGLAVSLLWCQAGPSFAAPGEAARAAEEFLVRFHRFRKAIGRAYRGAFGRYGRGQWLSAQSPWAPYLARPFSEGLGAAERRESLAAAEAGACKRVLALAERGWRRLHPRIAAALDDPAVARVFETVIVPGRSRAYRRCRALAVLGPLIKEAERRGEDVFLTQLAIAEGRLAPRAPVALDDRRVHAAIFVLERLALCDHYPPAIRDLARHDDALLYTRTAGLRGYYFLHLARSLGVAVPRFEEKAARRLAGVDPVAIGQIARAFTTLSPGEADARLYHRRDACRAPQIPLP